MGVFIKNEFGEIFSSVFGKCNNVTINGKKVVIDGKIVNIDEISDKEIHIHIEGAVDSLDVDACETIEVRGNVGSIKTMSGNVKVSNDVMGDVKTMSGNVNCGRVSGNISTMSGDIRQICMRQ